MTLLDELKNHANAIHEDTRRMFAALDDKLSAIAPRMADFETRYADIPPRVATLERKVFAPRKRSPRRATRRR